MPRPGKARSAGRNAGRDTCRRSTATSWRRTTISSSLKSDERKHRSTSAMTRPAITYKNDRTCQPACAARDSVNPGQERWAYAKVRMVMSRRALAHPTTRRQCASACEAVPVRRNVQLIQDRSGQLISAGGPNRRNVVLLRRSWSTGSKRLPVAIMSSPLSDVPAAPSHTRRRLPAGAPRRLRAREATRAGSASHPPQQASLSPRSGR